MDIHRGRFIPYPTHAITAAAFTRAHDLDLAPGPGSKALQPALRLALGRKNGDIEIWNPQAGQWIQESVFPGESSSSSSGGGGSGGGGRGGGGPSDDDDDDDDDDEPPPSPVQARSIDGLLWTQDPDDVNADGSRVLGQYRLFSIASSPAVTEWDLVTGTPGKRSSGNFSQVWCFAAQPRVAPQGKEEGEEEEEGKSSDIVAGCVNGTLVLLSTADGELSFKRTLVAASGKKAGCMSVVYQNRERVVAGFADGMIRVLDVRNGQTIRSMGVGVGVPGAPKIPYVWQVKCLPNGDIVSGDSNGEVKFWDGKFYSLTQNVAGHEADCLGLVVSTDGKTVFSGSMDGRVAVYRLTTNPDGRTSWSKSTHNRIHDGEVKSIAAFDSKKLSVVVSGGVDVAPIVNPLREYGKERYHILPSLPQEPPVTSARLGRLLVSWWDKTISIWRFLQQSSLEITPEQQSARRLVAKMELDVQDKIRSVAISEDGRALLVSTNSEVKAFQLRRRAGSQALGIRRIPVPEKIQSFGARLTGFSPDGKWAAIITLDNEVHVMRVSSVPEKPKLLRIVGVVELERDDPRESVQTGLKDYSFTISRLAFAPDSSVLVVGDLSGNLDTWVLEGQEDPTKPAIDIAESNDDDEDDSDVESDSSSNSSDDDDEDDIVFYGQRWTDRSASRRLPKLDSAPVILSFRPQQAFAKMSETRNGSADHIAHRLWVLTTKHQMYEFDVLEGRLSDWSREHPTSSLPKEFRRIKARVMGAMWDITEQRQAIWLYGTNWLLMLNVNDDIAYESARNTKRKGGQDDSAIKKQKTSGAGDKHGREYRHVPHVVRRYENGTRIKLRLDPAQTVVDEEDEDVDLGVTLPERLKKSDANPNGESTGRKSPQCWVTDKYRPILGIVPLGGVFRNSEEEALELVILERPLQDARSREE